MKVSTIEGYKSAILATFKTRGQSLDLDPYLCGLVNSFYTNRPVECNLVPHWDLSVVLGAITPFAPKNMVTIDLKILIFKTVFLLALATGARHVEIRALDRSLIRWSANGKDIYLGPRVGFVSKIQVAHNHSTTLTVFFPITQV